MAQNMDTTRADSYIRYRHYFREIWRFYEKPVARVSIALLLTVFSITFFAAFAISPTLNTIGELLKKIESQKEILQQLQKKSSALATVQNEYSVAQNLLPLLEEAMPVTPNHQQLLLLIEATAADNGLSISSMQIQPDIIIGQPVETGQTEEIIVNLSIEATYLQLNSFLKDISRLPRLVVIDSISFQESKNTNNIGSGALLLSIRLRAFFQSPASADAPVEEVVNTINQTEEESF